MKVSDLIGPATKKWDLNMLNGFFNTQEVELISSIPLCPNKVEDVVVWPFTPSSIYMVRSDTSFFLHPRSAHLYTQRVENFGAAGISYVVASTAFQALADFQRANSMVDPQSRSSSHSGIQWSPPPVGEIKVNFDRAQFINMGKAGLGVVIRDSRGQALATLSEQASLPFSPKIVEAMAAARAISFA
ncbi:hypothetical protein SO802_020519 [Lithocarpus litseifolius]|uniref:RNase H type-1 domain-containing protein n=1 Tax=Lithocarpus litseifolius TaxID=425828 RepID=A0AAW2CDT6_9ROSI